MIFQKCKKINVEIGLPAGKMENPRPKGWPAGRLRGKIPVSYGVS